MPRTVVSFATCFKFQSLKVNKNEPYYIFYYKVQINHVRNNNLICCDCIVDDNMKEKKITKWGTDEDAIASGRLAEIIKESMGVFSEFVRADKASQQIGSDVKDPEISDLVVDVRTELHKVCFQRDLHVFFC